MRWNQSNMYIKSWRAWIFLSYICMILYISAQTGYELSWFFQLWKYDKIVHFIEYLGVGFLLINAMKIQPLNKTHWKFAILFLFIFPIIDESVQHYAPQRIPDIIDGIFDILGGLTGAYIRRYL